MKADKIIDLELERLLDQSEEYVLMLTEEQKLILQILRLIKDKEPDQLIQVRNFADKLPKVGE